LQAIQDGLSDTFLSIPFQYPHPSAQDGKAKEGHCCIDHESTAEKEAEGGKEQEEEKNLIFNFFWFSSMRFFVLLSLRRKAGTDVIIFKNFFRRKAICVK
jgi:hypothetical protein